MNAELGREEGDIQTWRTIGELLDGDWLDVTAGRYQFERPNWPLQIVVTDKARQFLDGWPSGGGDVLYSRFLEALDEAIASANSPEERTRIEKLRTDAGDVGKGVLVSILSNLARIHGIPL